MTEQQQPISAPVLATPDTHIFEEFVAEKVIDNSPRLSDDELYEVYEVTRTTNEIWEGGWKTIALQFPDCMLHEAPRVFEAVAKELKRKPVKAPTAENAPETQAINAAEQSFNHMSTTQTPLLVPTSQERQRLYILADTSYGACCVDEIAAEHVDADVVVHYGRACLSPTARLPVIYVFTSRPLQLDSVAKAFEGTYPDREAKVLLMADVTYDSHISAVREKLDKLGYKNLLAPEVVHDPSAVIPNRKLNGGVEVQEYSLFHISDPPPSLLLTLSSRVKKMHIYPPTTTPSTPDAAISANTKMALRRRYALLTSLSTCAIFGILINTLSVRNYLETASKIKQQISAAGKKSYTFVVGKVNAAKVANFSEIGGWVVVGCWESSLIDSSGFHKPIITPFELSLALKSDRERVWNGEWTGDLTDFLERDQASAVPFAENSSALGDEAEATHNGDGGDLESEEESEPPEFDLRTGQYVSHSRPIRAVRPSGPASPAGAGQEGAPASKVIITRLGKGDLATVNGAVSPGAEFLRTHRTWKGLGSDFEDREANVVVEGRSGIASGYTIGDDEQRR